MLLGKTPTPFPPYPKKDTHTSITKQIAVKQANVVKYDLMTVANFPQHISPFRLTYINEKDH